MKDIKNFESIYMCSHPVDFRKGILSLSVFVKSEFDYNPFDGSLFLFTNKRRDAIKMLYWDKTGFAMWHKLLEEEKFPWTIKSKEKIVFMTEEQLKFILNGIDVFKFKPHQELKYSVIS